MFEDEDVQEIATDALIEIPDMTDDAVPQRMPPELPPDRITVPREYIHSRRTPPQIPIDAFRGLKDAVPSNVMPEIPSDELRASIDEFCNACYERSDIPKLPDTYEGNKDGAIETYSIPATDEKIEYAMPDYANAEKRMEDFIADVQIADVVNDCYILAAQIDAEQKKKPEGYMAFSFHDDEELAGEGIEELISGLKK